MLSAILALCLIGLVQIYSVTYSPTSGASGIYYTQIYGIVLGMVALLVCLIPTTIGALLSGVLADLFGMTVAIACIALLTVLSGLHVAIRMKGTKGA